MNKTLLRNLSASLLVAATMTFSSCKDDEPTPSKMPLLIDKSWGMVKTEMNGIDVTEDIDECDTDNLLTFSEDGSFAEDLGDLRCDEFETDGDGTWKFKANNTVISIHRAGSDAEDWTIKELTETTFKISQYSSLIGGEVIVTMQPQ